MKRWFLTWSIENRDGSTRLFSEVIEGLDWEHHVATTVERQQPDDSGRYVARWSLVFLVEMQNSGVSGSEMLKATLDQYEQ